MTLKPSCSVTDYELTLKLFTLSLTLDDDHEIEVEGEFRQCGGSLIQEISVGKVDDNYKELIDSIGDKIVRQIKRDNTATAKPSP
jgi:hypothetical protein